MKVIFSLFLSLFLSNCIVGQTVFSDPFIVHDKEDDILGYGYDIYGADIDSDGDLDVIATSAKDDRITWYENLDGKGNFGTEILIDDTNFSPTWIDAGDIDGDGHADILVCGNNGYSIRWFRNVDGFGDFTYPLPVNTFYNKSIRLAKLTDVDQDGDLDIIISGTTNGLGGYFVQWLENESGATNNPEFNTIHNIHTNAEYHFAALEIADLNGDNYLDIVYTSPYTDEVFMALNENGTFGDPVVLFDWTNTTTPPLNGATPIAIGDIDNDGDNDIMVGEYFGGDIVTFENLDGEGNFSSLNFIPGPPCTGAISFSLADFDNDGDLDLVSASNWGDKLFLHDNIGGEFGEAVIIAEGMIEPYSLFFGDYDRDDDLDLICGVAVDNSIIYLKNLLNSPSVSGTLFFDENQNQIKDFGEFGIGNQMITADPSPIATYSNQTGYYKFALNNEEHVLQASAAENWASTMTADAYTIDVQDSVYSGINFGFYPIEEFTKVVANITAAATRCGFEVPFWITYENVGTTFANGYVAFEIDPLTTFVSSNPQPDSIDNNTYFWQFENLPPTYSESIHLVLQMPGVDELGTEVEFETTTFVQDSLGNLEECQLYKYLSTINCAYDPNDKQVTPPGVFAENLTLFNEEFEYTIRFQNTGTDTAFTVRLEDQLDTDLDWSTFQPIAASHAYSVTLAEGGLVEFLFENILLPDSTTNEVASHGFAKYRIQPLTDLEENTEILNTANIFFDFNPPIQTNTTLNTMVSEITSVDEVLAEVEMDVSPNPFEEEVQFQIGELSFSKEATLTIFDVNGQRLQQFLVAANSTIAFNGKNLPAGIYFYQLEMNGSHLKAGKLVKN